MRGDDKFSRRLFLECDCHEHMMEVSRFYDEPDEWYFNFWLQGRGERSLLERLKLAWKVLRGARASYDEIILRSSQVQELFKFIGENLATGGDAGDEMR